MKVALAVLLLTLSQAAAAIPVFAVIPAGASTLRTEGTVLIGHQKVETGRYWTWHGKARKYSYVPLYGVAPAAAAAPEASTYAMMLVGMGLVAWRVQRRTKK